MPQQALDTGGQAVDNKRVRGRPDGRNNGRHSPLLPCIDSCHRDPAVAVRRPGPGVDVMSGSLAGRRVLVTGGGGFIGSHLVRAFDESTDVTVLDRLSTDGVLSQPDGVTVVSADLRDEDALACAMTDVDVVFHLAAMVSVERSVAEPRECAAINTGGTVDVLEAARRQDARVVFASSAAVYGPTAVPVAESAPKTPDSPYGVAKLAADQYVRLYADLYGLETVALRYFNVYGSGADSGVVAAFVSRALGGEPLVVHGDGTQTRDFVHVSDVVRATLAAATTTDTGRAFNVGTGRRVSVRELAETVRSATGSDSEIVHREERPGDLEHSQADVTRARRVLGFESTVDLCDGIGSLLPADPPL
jgi:UDP-glucose 4-epimerase